MVINGIVKTFENLSSKYIGIEWEKQIIFEQYNVTLHLTKDLLRKLSSRPGA